MDYLAANIQRKEEFEDTLLTLMQEIPYEKITVKDLAEEMNLVRKTFYHYFPNKQACLESLTDRLILNCSLHLLQSQSENISLQEHYTTQLLYWMEHRDFLNSILRNDLDAFLVERYMTYILRENKSIQEDLCTEAIHCDEDVLFFCLSGQISLLLKWCAEGFTLPVEEMAAKIIRLGHEPLLSPEHK